MYMYQQTGYHVSSRDRQCLPPQSSIHPKHSCSQPQSLDARVKSHPSKTLAHSYVNIQNTSIQVVQASQLTIPCDFWSIFHSKESVFCDFYQYIIHEVYTHVYNATILATMSSESLLTVEENASLQVWKVFYHDVYGMYCCLVMGGVGGGSWAKRKRFVYKKCW